jgi:hypothetical protein
VRLDVSVDVEPTEAPSPVRVLWSGFIDPEAAAAGQPLSFRVSLGGMEPPAAPLLPVSVAYNSTADGFNVAYFPLEVCYMPATDALLLRNCSRCRSCHCCRFIVCIKRPCSAAVCVCVLRP